MFAYTDYPFVELGDIPNQITPVREVEVVAYDRDKYATVLFDNVYESIKTGYLYRTNNVNDIRAGKVKFLSKFHLHSLPIEDGGKPFTRKQVTTYLKKMRKASRKYYGSLRKSVKEFYNE